MRFPIEAREPFLATLIALALNYPGSALVTLNDAAVWGNASLRALFDLAADALPAAVRDRRKTPFNEGRGHKRPRPSLQI